MKIGFRRSVYAQELPAGNYIIMVLATITFAIQILGDPKQQYLNSFVLRHLTFASIFGYMWLHMSMAHIVGNLITLWIFGRYVNLKISDASYFLSYVLLGIAAGSVHVYYDGRPTIGASGAIMGILGMYVVLCFKRFGILGPWLIVIWFILDLTACAIGRYPTTYMAHAGGFLAGMFLATLLIVFRVAKCDDAGQSLLRIIRPSLCKVYLYENHDISEQAAPVKQIIYEINNDVGFQIEEIKTGKKVLIDKSLYQGRD